MFSQETRKRFSHKKGPQKRFSIEVKKSFSHEYQIGFSIEAQSKFKHDKKNNQKSFATLRLVFGQKLATTDHKNSEIRHDNPMIRKLVAHKANTKEVP